MSKDQDMWKGWERKKKQRYLKTQVKFAEVLHTEHHIHPSKHVTPNT